jgi:hypothetical protein
MNAKEKAVLTAGFEALGPERLTRGLRATGHKWNDCFWAIATYGEPDALLRQMRKEHSVGAVIGVPVEVVKAVVRLWDDEEQTFRALAAEWLELNRGGTMTRARVGAGQCASAAGVDWLLRD